MTEQRRRRFHQKGIYLFMRRCDFFAVALVFAALRLRHERMRAEIFSERDIRISGAIKWEEKEIGELST